MKISIIVPTYTGEDCVAKCIESIAKQTTLPDELVIVIDGPNDNLRKIVEASTAQLKNKIPVVVHQLDKNEGRFMARYKGAQLATNETAVFIDDRVRLESNFLKTVKGSNHPAGLTKITEETTGNVIERINSLIRHRAYAKYEKTPAFLTKDNFNLLPKGTAGLWAPRKIFLEACDRLRSSENISHDTSDDTKLLSLLVEKQHIYRAMETTLYYRPRHNFFSSAVHLFQRGPKFVDFYIKKGTKFHSLLIAFLWALILVIAGIALLGVRGLEFILGVFIVGVIVSTLYLFKNPADLIIIPIGLPIVIILFGAGIIKGVVVKCLR